MRQAHEPYTLIWSPYIPIHLSGEELKELCVTVVNKNNMYELRVIESKGTVTGRFDLTGKRT